MDIRTKRRSLLGQPYGASSTSLKLSSSQLHPVVLEEPLPAPDKRVKLVCVGDGAIGKTSLLSRYVRGEFPEEYVPTVFENYVKNIEFEQQNVELALWDTAGQEDYDRLRALSYPESDVIVMCYACDSASSLENVMDRWYPEVALYCPNVPQVLVGLKSDIAIPEETTFDRAQAVADKLGVYTHIWCSAKLGTNVQQVFDSAVRAVLFPTEPSKPAPKPASNESISTSQTKARRKPSRKSPDKGTEKRTRRRDKVCLVC